MTSDLFNIALDFFYKEHQEQNRQFGRTQEVLQGLLMLENIFCLIPAGSSIWFEDNLYFEHDQNFFLIKNVFFDQNNIFNLNKLF